MMVPAEATGGPPIVRGTSVVSRVAAFAPVRHTWFQGTTLPKISRPRFRGPVVELVPRNLTATARMSSAL